MMIVLQLIISDVRLSELCDLIVK